MLFSNRRTVGSPQENCITRVFQIGFQNEKLPHPPAKEYCISRGTVLLENSFAGTSTASDLLCNFSSGTGAYHGNKSGHQFQQSSLVNHGNTIPARE
ncbi:hypothetical protein SLEP1_g8121 [Rubroshorea leprosula]|uniref:Uncharacterized protein n=1 Tax=Rubroshorea leprosula TaxID=152421 RepID=A0AAV5I564_9ROSI|nr:hypothetical protein SLEP1_g8121 [Rubroshorea leprosula]